MYLRITRLSGLILPKLRMLRLARHVIPWLRKMAPSDRGARIF